MKPKLLVSTDEGRLETLRPTETLALSDDAHGSPRVSASSLPFRLELTDTRRRRSPPDDARQVASSTRTVPGSAAPWTARRS